MFDSGDFVIYGNEGVCEVAGVSEMSINNKCARYYELIPKYRKNTSVLVPVDNEKLTAKMLPILSKEDVIKLIGEIPDVECEWIENENLRKERYKQMLVSKDRRELVSIIKTIDAHREECEKKGRKLHACDERIFAEAKEKLHNEVAAVLGLTPEQARGYILDSLKKAEDNA